MQIIPLESRINDTFSSLPERPVELDRLIEIVRVHIDTLSNLETQVKKDCNPDDNTKRLIQCYGGDEPFINQVKNVCDHLLIIAKLDEELVEELRELLDKEGETSLIPSSPIPEISDDESDLFVETLATNESASSFNQEIPILIEEMETFATEDLFNKALFLTDQALKSNGYLSTEEKRLLSLLKHHFHKLPNEIIQYLETQEEFKEAYHYFLKLAYSEFSRITEGISSQDELEKLIFFFNYFNTYKWYYLITTDTPFNRNAYRIIIYILDLRNEDFELIEDDLLPLFERSILHLYSLIKQKPYRDRIELVETTRKFANQYHKFAEDDKKLSLLSLAHLFMIFLSYPTLYFPEVSKIRNALNKTSQNSRSNFPIQTLEELETNIQAAYNLQTPMCVWISLLICIENCISAYSQERLQIDYTTKGNSIIDFISYNHNHSRTSQMLTSLLSRLQEFKNKPPLNIIQLLFLKETLSATEFYLARQISPFLSTEHITLLKEIGTIHAFLKEEITQLTYKLTNKLPIRTVYLSSLESGLQIVFQGQFYNYPEGATNRDLIIPAFNLLIFYIAFANLTELPLSLTEITYLALSRYDNYLQSRKKEIFQPCTYDHSIDCCKDLITIDKQATPSTDYITQIENLQIGEGILLKNETNHRTWIVTRRKTSFSFTSIATPSSNTHYIFDHVNKLTLFLITNLGEQVRGTQRKIKIQNELSECHSIEDFCPIRPQMREDFLFLKLQIEFVYSPPFSQISWDRFLTREEISDYYQYIMSWLSRYEINEANELPATVFLHNFARSLDSEATKKIERYFNKLPAPSKAGFLARYARFNLAKQNGNGKECLIKEISALPDRYYNPERDPIILRYYLDELEEIDPSNVMAIKGKNAEITRELYDEIKQLATNSSR